MIYADFKDFIQNLPHFGPLLGIDWGLRRTGLAITDNAREFVFPREIITAALLPRITEIIESEKAAGVVIGLPIRTDGSDSETTSKVRAFANELASSSNIPIMFVDERLSSAAAEEIIGASRRKVGRGKKVQIDSRAAAVILEDAIVAIKRIKNNG
ncbi:MAG: Holliday junction resolvase RuvX [Rickettsiales bacterium]|jgi:putative Holliday junction resolvase|nr:Holliday junction resolvase RuvX [Rickettsiales bacterium]